jgi:pimeloyl-ACP methyl ester carboxylesterase
VLTAITHPELVDRLVLWNPVGGVFSTMSLGAYYAMPSLGAARSAGIQAVMELPEWSTLIDANPRNKQRFLDLGGEGFFTAMLRWLNAYVPTAGRTIPGVDDWLIQQVDAPALVIRSGRGDLDHPASVSYALHTLIKGSRFAEPPWAEDAWERAVEGERAGTGTCLDHWVEAAPLILGFAAEDGNALDRDQRRVRGVRAARTGGR